MLRIPNQAGSLLIGKIAPERKNIGSTKNWVTIWNDSTCEIRAASITPKAVRARDLP